MNRTRLLMVFVALAFALMTPVGCKGLNLKQKPSTLPEPPAKASPMVERAETAVADAARKAEVLAPQVPEALKPQMNALRDDLITARIELAAARAATEAQDRYDTQLRKALAERDKIIEALQARVADLEEDHGFNASTWFMLIGGGILAGAVAVAIWVNVKAGLLAGTAGGVLFGIGLVLEYLSRNQWIIWCGAAAVVAGAVYLVWKYGGGERFKKVVDVLVAAGEKVGLSVQKDAKGEVARTAADAGVADVVKAETTASKERQGLPTDALGKADSA